MLQIDATSRIDGSGYGFLGGLQPGNPIGIGMTLGFFQGSTGSSGGSHGGLGGAFNGATNPLYGSNTNPNEVGSGGGGFQGAPAGNGGGLARIVAQSIVVNGAIRANGGVATQFSAGGRERRRNTDRGRHSFRLGFDRRQWKSGLAVGWWWRGRRRQSRPLLPECDCF